MIEVCYCSPNRSGNKPCHYCWAKADIIQGLSNLLVEFTEEDFETIFNFHQISQRARLNILVEIDDKANEYAG